MKSMLLAHPAAIDESPLQLRDLPVPEPAAGEIRVRVAACGICRTDLHVVEGELPPQRQPVVPGHQVVGVVDGRGPGATRFKDGDRVGIAWLRSTCGTCRYCRAGNENLCPQARFTGYHADGGYAEYAVVRDDFAYALPAALGDAETTPLLCAGIIGYRALRRAEMRPGGRLGLYGFGSSAHSAILFAPVGELVLPALEALDDGGTLALAGIYLTDIPALNYERHLFHEKNLRSVTANTRQDGEELLRIAAEIPIRPQTTSFPLADANRALQQLKHDGIQGSGVLVVGT
jgi:propanol-preferring alcohol dehydrogenase